jgi:hypothetical protein
MRHRAMQHGSRAHRREQQDGRSERGRRQLGEAARAHRLRGRDHQCAIRPAQQDRRAPAQVGHGAVDPAQRQRPRVRDQLRRLLGGKGAWWRHRLAFHSVPVMARPEYGVPRATGASGMWYVSRARPDE